MSKEQSDAYSSPTTAGGLFLRVLLAVLVVGSVGGVIWYMTK